MLPIILFSIVGIILFYLNLKKVLGRKDLINVISLIINMFGVLILPTYTVIFDQTPLWVIIVTIIFGILFPALIAIVEYASSLAFSEFIIISMYNLNKMLGKNREAKDIIKRYLEKNKKSYILHKKMGEIYEAEGGIRKAINEYVKVLEIDETDYDTFFKLTTLMQEINKKEEVIDLLKKLIKVKPDFEKAYLMLCDNLIFLGQTKEALKYYLEGEKNITENYEYYYNIAYNLVLLNEYSKARTYLEKAYALNVRGYAVLLNLGQILMIFKEYKEAKKYLEKATKCKEISDVAYYQLAKIHIVNEEVEEAIEALNNSLEINPEMLDKINDNELFKDIKEKIVVKVQLVKKQRIELSAKVSEMINNLEDVLELSLLLEENAKKHKTQMIMQEIIRTNDENKSIEEMEHKFNKTTKFIEENIENIDL